MAQFSETVFLQSNTRLIVIETKYKHIWEGTVIFCLTSVPFEPISRVLGLCISQKLFNTSVLVFYVFSNDRRRLKMNPIYQVNSKEKIQGGSEKNFDLFPLVLKKFIIVLENDHRDIVSESLNLCHKNLKILNFDENLLF